MKPRYLLAVLAVVPIGVHAAPSPVPGFRQLETAYGETGGLDAAAEQMSLAIPPGTALTRARSALEAAGATCKTVRNDAGPLRCLIHQYSLADGAADDIRWTIWVHAPAAVVSVVKLDRYVDRHGSD